MDDIIFPFASPSSTPTAHGEADTKASIVPAQAKSLLRRDILPSGHTWAEASVLVKRVIGGLQVSEDEAEELHQEGLIVVWQSDADHRPDAGMGWGDYMLTRLRGRLNDCLITLRKRGFTGGDDPPETESLSAYGHESTPCDDDEEPAVLDIEDTALRPLHDLADTAQFLELVQTVLTAGEFEIVADHFGLDGRPARSLRQIAETHCLGRNVVRRKYLSALEKIKSACQK